MQKMLQLLFVCLLPASLSVLANSQFKLVDTLSNSNPLFFDSIIMPNLDSNGIYHALNDNKHFIVTNGLNIGIYAVDNNNILEVLNSSPTTPSNSAQLGHITQLVVDPVTNIIFVFYENYVQAYSITSLSESPQLTLLNGTSFLALQNDVATDNKIASISIQDIAIRNHTIAVLDVSGAIHKITYNNGFQSFESKTNQSYIETYNPISIAIDHSGEIVLGNNPDKCEVGYDDFICHTPSLGLETITVLSDLGGPLQHIESSIAAEGKSRIISSIEFHSGDIFAYDTSENELLILDNIENKYVVKAKIDDSQEGVYKWKINSVKNEFALSEDKNTIVISSAPRGATQYIKTSPLDLNNHNYQKSAELSSGNLNLARGASLSPSESPFSNISISNNGALAIKNEFAHLDAQSVGPTHIGVVKSNGGTVITPPSDKLPTFWKANYLQNNQFLVSHVKKAGNAIVDFYDVQGSIIQVQENKLVLNSFDLPLATSIFHADEGSLNSMYTNGGEYTEFSIYEENQQVCSETLPVNYSPYTATISLESSEMIFVNYDNTLVSRKLEPNNGICLADTEVAVTLPETFPNTPSLLRLNNFYIDYSDNTKQSLAIMSYNNNAFSIIDKINVMNHEIYGLSESFNFDAIMYQSNETKLTTILTENNGNLNNSAFKVQQEIESQGKPLTALWPLDFDSKTNLLLVETREQGSYSKDKYLVLLGTNSVDNVWKVSQGYNVLGNNGYLLNNQSEHVYELYKLTFAPELLENKSIYSDEGTPFSLALDDIVIDKNNDALSFEMLQLPSDSSFENNTVSGTLAVGNYEIKFSATDSDGEKAEFTIPVSVTNIPPSFSDKGTIKLSENDSLNITLTNYFTDYTQLQFSSDDLPTSLTLNNGNISGQLSVGTHNFTVEAIDENSASTKGVFSVEVSTEDKPKSSSGSSLYLLALLFLLSTRLLYSRTECRSES